MYKVKSDTLLHTSNLLMSPSRSWPDINFHINQSCLVKVPLG